MHLHLSMKTIFIKLGGSCITDKSKLCTFDEATTTSILEQICAIDGLRLCIAHGAGSFGHILAKEHQLQDGIVSEDQVMPAAQVHADVVRLQGYIVERGLRMGLPLFALQAPSHWLGKTAQLESLVALMERGFIPVLHGDIIMENSSRGIILSADTIVKDMALEYKRTHPSDEVRIIHVGDYDGVLGVDGKVLSRIGAHETLPEDIFHDPAHPDVTGGMRLKVLEAQEAARAGILVSIVNGRVPGTLLKTLQGSLDKGSHVQP